MSDYLYDDGFDAVGEVEIRKFKFDEEGNKIFVEPYEKNNLIVEIGRSVVVDLILGESRKKLEFIEWGSGGAPTFPEGDPLIEHEVNDKDVSLGHAVIKKKLNPHIRMNSTKFQYIETLISDEVDSNINEAALIFRDVETGEQTMFARITFPTISLLADKGFGVELTWTINFRKIRYRPDCESEENNKEVKN